MGIRGLGRRRPGDGYPAPAGFADLFTGVPGCPADTIGP